MASKKILIPYDFSKNEIQNVVAQNLAANPSTPKPGQFYFDTAVNRWLWRDATKWVDPLDRANHTGTQLAATISDLPASIAATRISALSPPNADVPFGGQRITSLADGSSASDAATFGQLQAVVNGRDFKESVRVATTAPVAQTSLAAIDGVTLVDGDRVLDKDATDATKRGLWIAHTGAWTRATDADTSAKVTPNLTVMVEEGTANADKQFTLTTNAPIVLGTTALAFAQTGAGTTYTQGSGILLTGSTISVDPAYVARKFAADIGDGVATSIAVTHNLGTVDAIMQVYDKATGATVECDAIRTSASVATLVFAVAPAAAAYRVVVQA